MYIIFNLIFIIGTDVCMLENVHYMGVRYYSHLEAFGMGGGGREGGVGWTYNLSYPSPSPRIDREYSILKL